MKMDIYVVDAFTSRQFKGNSAAVVPITDWSSDELMQNIAAENNLSETAFIKQIEAHSYEIRWFSPVSEVDFCGHATLASAYVLFNHMDVASQVEFITREVGNLTVVHKDNGDIEMTFPNQKPQVVDAVPPQLLAGLSKAPTEVLKNRQAYFAIYEHEQDIHELTYELEQLKQLAPLDVVVTAKADESNTISKDELPDYDFVSRYFWPVADGEDPVTGSIHTGLAPYWADKLGKIEFVAYQASKRGGMLKCRVLNDNVVISGTGVLYLKGEIFV